MNSANRYIIFLLLAGMLLQINSVVACYLLFFLNRKAIAETVCEKKTRACSGHCFLKKKMAETVENGAQHSDKPSSAKSPEELLHSITGLEPDRKYALRISLSACLSGIYTSPILLDGVKGKIDRPPKA